MIAYRINALSRDISKQEKKEQAERLRKEGRSYRQIAEWLGVHHTTIIKWCGENSTGEKPPVEKIESSDGKLRPASKMVDEEIIERRQQIKAARDEGKKIADIANEFGVSVGTVHRDIEAVESLTKKTEEGNTEPSEEEESRSMIGSGVVDPKVYEMIEYAARTSAEAPMYREDDMSADNRLRFRLAAQGIDSISQCLLGVSRLFYFAAKSFNFFYRLFRQLLAKQRIDFALFLFGQVRKLRGCCRTLFAGGY